MRKTQRFEAFELLDRGGAFHVIGVGDSRPDGVFAPFSGDVRRQTYRSVETNT
jgi:hypothetical protein